MPDPVPLDLTLLFQGHDLDRLLEKRTRVDLGGCRGEAVGTATVYR